MPPSPFRGRPLRVCHLIQYFHVGGIERLVLAIGRGLAPNVVTTAIAYTSDGPFRAVLDAGGIETDFLATRPGIQLTLPMRLAAALRRHRIDVLHTHHVGPFLYGGAAAVLARIPHVHTEHSRELYDRPRRRAIGAAMPRFARVVTVSQELSDFRRATFGDEPIVITNGVEIPALPTTAVRWEARRRAGTPPGAYVIGSVARLSDEKAPVRLVEAFAAGAARKGAWLVMVGDGDERSAVEAAVRRLGLDGQVRLLGSRDDVDALLPGFDVIALASRREGLPLALLEGMAAGLPVVATAVGGIPALLADGGGIAVPEPDADGLAAALATYADPALRGWASERARTIAVQKYSNRPMLDRYEALYVDLSERGRR